MIMAREAVQSSLIESLREVAGRSRANRYGVVFGLFVQQAHAQRRAYGLDQLIFDLKSQDEGSLRFDEIFCRGAVSAIGDYGSAQAFAELETWGRCLRELAERHPEHAQIRNQLARGAVNAIIAYGSAQAFVKLETWGRCLRELAERHPEHAEIQLQLARGAVNAIIAYGSAQAFAELEAWGRYLRKLAERHPEQS
jgi:hypothetical protein